jgi:signal transduction histidine kinase
MTGPQTHADGGRSVPPGSWAAGDRIAGNSRFRAALEAMLDSVVITTAVRDDDGRIVDFDVDYINPAAEVGQRPAEQIVGRRFLDVWPSITESPIWEMYLHTVETGEPIVLDNFTYGDVINGHAVSATFDIRATRLDDGFLQTFRDVTERRQAEETMTSQAAQLARNAVEREDRIQQRTADLLRSNQELESFGYSVAHDLRSPLRAIDAYCQILLDDHAAQLDEDGQVLLGNVGRSAVRMGHLIEGLLALARIGRQDPEHLRIDMTALAESVVTDLRRGHAGAWPAIAVGQLADASGNPELARQVWDNLISNAVKFSAGQADARVSVESEVSAGEVNYYVRDNGVGFDMAYAGKLFGVFQRLHPAEFPGTGIGLAIVARIVERHGGRVWADGRVGDGACFSFTLPAAATEHGETP